VVSAADGCVAWRGLVVEKRDAGRRLDAFLSLRFQAHSRSEFARHILEGLVRSEKREVKPSTRIAEGEHLRIYVPGLAPTSPPPPLPGILFEDDRLIVADKPAGMLVHPAGERFVWSLVGLFREAYRDCRIDLVHRLDRDTSGAIMLSKDLEANAFMKDQFFRREVGKRYKAIVRGSPAWESVESRGAIGASPVSEIRLRKAVVPDGLSAHTSFRALRRMDGLSLVECVIHTGRTHQIRVHLEQLGLPILGDKIYGQPDSVFLAYIEEGADDGMRAQLRFPRHALHSDCLRFRHPEGGSRRIQAPLPMDMQRLVDGGVPSWQA
jgi:23S rRNA pseudouridine1911/1915/1917 synthase